MAQSFISLGNPKIPRFVFLHGFLGSGKSWLNIAQSFSENYFCIMPDLPGHGDNTQLDITAPLNFDILTEWLSRLLDQIPFQKFISLDIRSAARRLTLPAVTRSGFSP